MVAEALQQDFDLHVIVPLRHLQFQEFQQAIDYLVYRWMLVAVELSLPSLAQVAEGADTRGNEALAELARQLESVQIK